jgi:putative ABC transport system permease protein
MKLSFASKLAVQNIRSNKQIYLPFILSSMMTVAMFIMITSLIENPIVQDSASLYSLFVIGTIVVAIFSVIFIMYANSFLMKRRKKEIGLYNILGLEKRHIARVIAIETLISLITCLVVGMAVGTLFGQLNFWMINYILEIPQELSYVMEVSSYLQTSGLFAGIFLLTFLFNIMNVQFSNPIELLKGGNKGEKEPKGSFILFFLGMLALAGGYAISLTIDNPVQAILLFFVAVFLVIIGTYLIFNAGSIIVLKALKKNKAFYYRPGPFISVSGMLYRMKQHATGLANICILSVMVMIAVSTTIALYAGGEETLGMMFPEENEMVLYNAYDETGEVIVNDEEQTRKLNELIEIVLDEAEHFNLETEDVQTLRSASLYGDIENGQFISRDINDMPKELLLVTLDDYNRLSDEDRTLSENEVLVATQNVQLTNETIGIGDKELSLVDITEEREIPNILTGMNNFTGFMLIVFPTMEQLEESLAAMNELTPFEEPIRYQAFWNTDGSREEKREYAEHVRELLQDEEYGVQYEHIELARFGYIEIIGGLLFLGIYLGLLFVIGTVLITYFKQVSEGFDDREKIQAMQKVGLDKETTRKATRSQVVWMFLLPLVTAIIHTGFAYPILYNMINVLGRISHSLLMICIAVVIMVFAFLYGIIYQVTSKVYLRIVE